MELYVDGVLLGSQACSGNIVNSPYQVILGKSAELRDSHLGYLCNATLDRVRIFDSVISLDKLAVNYDSLKSASKLWLDFESAEESGSYYSIGIPGRTYGLVWPDRSIQPELWQLKKSPQPVKFEGMALEEGRIKITNRHHFRNLEELDFSWELTANGEVQEKGSFELDLAPGGTEEVLLPLHKEDVPGKVYHLLISAITTEDKPWAESGHEVAWEQFEFPSEKPAAKDEAVYPKFMLSEDESSVKVEGEGFVYTFDKKEGILSSMLLHGKELLNQGPRVNVWRAPLANDLDSWNFHRSEMGHVRDEMGKETANGWRSIGLDHIYNQLS
jgi:beta-galactosidase